MNEPGAQARQNLWKHFIFTTAQKIKLSIKDFFSKWEQIHIYQRNP